MQSAENNNFMKVFIFRKVTSIANKKIHVYVITHVYLDLTWTKKNVDPSTSFKFSWCKN